MIKPLIKRAGGQRYNTKWWSVYIDGMRVVGTGKNTPSESLARYNALRRSGRIELEAARP